MKVILKPISHPRLGDIGIVDDLFAVGRYEEPFASKLGDAAAHLSRRHARVFQEGGEIFLADLGSRNGTRVNERELQHNVATALHDNDRVTFGEAVEFQVEIRNSAAHSIDKGVDKGVGKTPAIRLALVPEDRASGLATIAVESFPFLVSRSEGEFAQLKERWPEAWRRLSRRHAVIALKGGRINVEDLGSSNGTSCPGRSSTSVRARFPMETSSPSATRSSLTRLVSSRCMSRLSSREHCWAAPICRRVRRRSSHQPCGKRNSPR